MLITKFDLYQTEWLDMVFANRNKNYGAYYLRQHYAKTMLKAMGIAFFSVAVLIGAYSLFRAPAVIEEKIISLKDKETIVDLTHPIEPPKEVAPPKLVEPVKPPAAAAQPKAQTAFIPTVVGPDDKPTVEPPTVVELATSAIGPEKSDGVKTDGNAGPGGGTDPSGTGTAPGEGSADPNKEYIVVEHMPEPVGGASAWQKYLQKNLRYPAQAIDAGVSGKIFLSFIIEKDGTLSNIKVERGLGYGLDDEAARVLKKAAAWKPGIQNGQPVRVKFSIPINFQMPSE